VSDQPLDLAELEAIQSAIRQAAPPMTAVADQGEATPLPLIAAERNAAAARPVLADLTSRWARRLVKTLRAYVGDVAVDAMGAEVLDARTLGDELPYGISTAIEKFEALPRLYRIFVGVIVDKEPHKAIVIGKQGEQLKRVASAARLDMERLFGKKVHLEVFVKVRHGWQDDPEQIKKMGYD
jgi:hypothetical protein